VQKNPKRCHSKACCVPKNLSFCCLRNQERFPTSFGMSIKNALFASGLAFSSPRQPAADSGRAWRPRFRHNFTRANDESIRRGPGAVKRKAFHQRQRRFACRLDYPHSSRGHNRGPFHLVLEFSTRRQPIYKLNLCGHADIFRTFVRDGPRLSMGRHEDCHKISFRFRGDRRRCVDGALAGRFKCAAA
jgi:hypothetical protein